MKFYINNEGVILSQNKITNALIAEHGYNSNWRDMFKNNWVVYCEDHPEIMQLGKVYEHDKKYYNIPTDYLIKNISNNDIWGSDASCFNAVNYDLLNIIERVIKNGIFPYNSTIAEEFCKDNGISYNTELHFLNSIVYCTQTYKHDLDNKKHLEDELEEMTKNGFSKLTEEMAEVYIENSIKCFVQLKGTSILGGDTKKISEVKMTLRKNGDGLIWMPPRATRKGYTAYLGQYVRPITSTNKN